MKKRVYFIITILSIGFTLSACTNQLTSFTITFDSNGGSIVEPIITAENSTISIPQEPNKDGYLFDGWFFDNDTFSQPFTANSLVKQPLTGDITVYAKWIDEIEQVISTFTVEFDSMGGNTVSKLYVQKGSTISIPLVTREGYSLDGWYTSFNNGQTFDEKWSFITNSVNNDIKLYAKWVINQYTITFDSKGGSTVINIEQDYNTLINKPIEPTRDGYVFMGWFFDEELTNEYNFTTMQAEHITLYAKWIIPYTIEFIGFNNTRISIEIYEFGSDLSDVIVPIPPDVAGYQFIGWDIELPLIMPSQNIVIKAMYAIYLEYKIIDNYIEITGLNNNSITNIVIPASINDIPVTKIGYEAFAYDASFTSITIPSSVTSIGNHAFNSATSLTSITIPSSVTSIGE